MNPQAYYNSMQAQAGMLPAPQVVFPGQVSAAVASQGGMGAFGTLFPTQTYQTSVGTPPIFQGPTGLMAQVNPSAPYNPYAASNAAANPYAGLSAFSRGQASAFTPYAPPPPPAYGGLQGSGAVPFAPPPARVAFDTPYGASVSQGYAQQDRSWIMSQGAAGVSARLGADIGAGMLGAKMGSRFGAPGAVLGGFAGFAASEFGGLGQGVQNAFGNMFTAPRMATYGMGNAIENLSQGFVSGGAFMGPRGQGFSHAAAHEAAEGLTALSGSASFRRETQDRFNQQDVARITQLSAESGMMGGVSSPTAMTGRVKEIAKSLSAFMELAKEPDVVRAIQTMGSLRASGLNLQETMSAVSAGRTYARMAGTTFANVAEMGGSMGSQTMQSMGLSQGLGFRAGMANYGIAASGMNSGVINPQLASLVGGAQGLGTLNTMFSGAMMQHPMVTPGMMGAAGGLDANAIQRMMSGQSNMFDMTGRGSGVLGGMAGRYGAAGLGMAVAMQPMLQDSLGRMIQAQGSFAGRNMEDRQVLAMARQMGMHGSQGYLTAAQAMGMDRNQALTRATEMSSPTYWSNQRSQLETERREARANADRNEEQDAPSLAGTIYRYTPVGHAGRAIRRDFHHIGVKLNRMFGGESTYLSSPLNDGDRRDLYAGYNSDSYREYMRTRRPADSEDGLLDRLSHGAAYSRANGDITGLGALMRLGTDSAAERAEQRRDMRSGADFSTDMLAATHQQRQYAVRHANELYGSTEGLQRFTQSLGNMAHTYGGERSLLGSGFNGLVRGVAQYATMGAVDPGNVVGLHIPMGSEIENRYREMMRRQGKSEEEITRTWQSQRANIAAGVNDMMEMRGMTAEQRAVWRASRDSTSGNTGVRDTREDASRAYRSFLGDSGHQARDVWDSVHGEAEGIGRRGSEKFNRTRNIISNLALLRTLRERGEDRDGSVTRLQDELTKGLSAQDLAVVSQRSQALAARYGNSEGAADAARGLVNRGQGASTLLDREGRAESAIANQTRERMAATGFTALARQGGVLGSVLQGLSRDGHYDQEGIQRALRNMTPDQLRQLQVEGHGSPEVASMIRRYQASGNFGNVEAFSARLGEAGEATRREWTASHSGRIRAASFLGAAASYALPLPNSWRGKIREGVQGVINHMREDAVADALTPHSAQEREAMLSGRDSASAQGEAEGAGLGRAGDALLEASRELRRASEQLSNSTLVGAVSNLVGSNTPTP